MEKSISLFYREGSSDKVYNASIEVKDSGFVVNFSYGRRGNALTTGTKTSSPVDLPSAQKIFDKLVKEKTSKGYTEDTTGKTVGISTTDSKDSGFRCQQPNSIEEDQALRLLEDDNYIMQEKHDGRRLSIKKTGDQLTGINKKGLAVAIHPDLAKLKSASLDFMVDGEDMGDGVVFCFDALEFNGQDLRALPFSKRLEFLTIIITGHGLPLIESIDAHNSGEKRKLFERLRSEGKEGVVFKLANSPYSPGRPASGGSHLKFKFYDTASFVVRHINEQRSVSIGLFDGGALQFNGNVTIPANHAIPQVGDVVEVRYLYAYKESGSVYQPVYLGKRDDVDAAECVVSQLKYKN